MQRLTLFTGLGANARLFERLQVASVELSVVELPVPEPGDDLPAYARRLGEAQGLTQDSFIGGCSFGGMIAAEIARQNGARACIQIGSALSPRQIPPHLRLAQRISRVLPNAVLERFPKDSRLLLRYFEPVGSAERALIVEMGRCASTKLVRRGSRMILRWRGVAKLPCPHFIIHGDRDRLIRPPRVSAVPAGASLQVIAGAGHACTLTHAHQVSAFISQALAKVP